MPRHAIIWPASDKVVHHVLSYMHMACVQYDLEAACIVQGDFMQLQMLISGRVTPAEQCLTHVVTLHASTMHTSLCRLTCNDATLACSWDVARSHSCRNSSTARCLLACSSFTPACAEMSAACVCSNKVSCSRMRAPCSLVCFCKHTNGNHDH